MTSVVNKNLARGDVYIGRAAGAVWAWDEVFGHWRLGGRRVAPHEPGYLGNPVLFRARCPICGREHEPSDRARALGCYATFLARRLRADADFAARVAALRGRALECYCSPRRCHGDLLAAVADGRQWCGACGALESVLWLQLGGDWFCSRCYRGLAP